MIKTYKHTIFAYCLAYFFAASWCASFDAVTEYEVKLQIKKAEQQVSTQAILDLNEELDSIKSIINRTHTVTATVYYPTGDEMRSGKSIPTHYTLYTAKTRYIAISQDLWKKNGGPYSFGDSIRVVGTDYDGIYVIEDTMNKRHRNRVDILVSGVINEQWLNVKIYKI